MAKQNNTRKSYLSDLTDAEWHKYRRLSKDYEVLTETREAMIYAATTRVMLRRLGRP